TSRVGYLLQRGPIGRRKNDSVFAAPCCSHGNNSVAQSLGCSAADRDLFQLTTSKESKPLAVRRKERRIGSLGAGYGIGFEVVQRTQINLPSTGMKADIGEFYAIWRERNSRVIQSGKLIARRQGYDCS